MAPPPPQLSLDDLVQIQEPFQSGSTPVHLQSRFMVWNQVGIVKAFASDEENSIDVKFHDSSVHHPIHLGNSAGFTMADLSTEALVLASEASDEYEAEEGGGGANSRLMCHYLGSSDVNKEWSVDMPTGEEIMAVCCGQGWVSDL